MSTHSELGRYDVLGVAMAVTAEVLHEVYEMCGSFMVRRLDMTAHCSPEIDDVYGMLNRALDTGALVNLLMKHRSFDHGGKRIDLGIAKCEADTMAAAVVEYIRGWSGDGA